MIKVLLDKESICGLVEECFKLKGCERVKCVLQLAKLLARAAENTECG